MKLLPPEKRAPAPRVWAASDGLKLAMACTSECVLPLTDNGLPMLPVLPRPAAQAGLLVRNCCMAANLCCGIFQSPEPSCPGCPGCRG